MLNLSKLNKKSTNKIISLQKRYEHLSIEVIQNKFVQKEKKTENILRHYVIFLNKNHHPLNYIFFLQISCLGFTIATIRTATQNWLNSFENNTEHYEWWEWSFVSYIREQILQNYLTYIQNYKNVGLKVNWIQNFCMNEICMPNTHKC